MPSPRHSLSSPLSHLPVIPFEVQSHGSANLTEAIEALDRIIADLNDRKAILERARAALSAFPTA